MSDLPKAKLSPVEEADIEPVAQFLHAHMNDKFSATEWSRIMRSSWVDDAPNFGFKLMADGQVVGALCAMYSEQVVNGVTERFCNPHSWCVLEPYRKKSVSLVLSVLRQDGYHHTMFSPNSEGEQIFAFLGFKPLDRTRRILPNLPLPAFGSKVEINADHDAISASLAAAQRREFEDHRHFSWLHFVGFRAGADAGYMIYRRARFKRLPCAGVIHISDRDLFSRCWPAIGRHLLLRDGVFTTRSELRLLGSAPALSFSTNDGSAKFYRSDSLAADAIAYSYSELTAVNL